MLMAKAVVRHLKYAWIEYGNPKDGQAFTDGLYSMGWGNLLAGLPIIKDKWGTRYVDSAHPLLPIRWRGSALMALPNHRLDAHKNPNPFLDEPLFNDFRKTNDDAAFETAIKQQNAFISQWVFCPGVKKVSDTEAHLTTAGDFTDFADVVAISGHGAVGMVWGGGDGAL